MSFNKQWPKLKQLEFTTFRYPRVDNDWYVGEQVQVFYKARSKDRQRLGEAAIIGKEHRELERFFARDDRPLVTDAEAIADGFESREDMANYLEKLYGLDYISLFHKLTLRWLKTI